MAHSHTLTAGFGCSDFVEYRLVLEISQVHMFELEYVAAKVPDDLSGTFRFGPLCLLRWLLTQFSGFLPGQQNFRFSFLFEIRHSYL